MQKSWDELVNHLWQTADTTAPDVLMERMSELVATQPEGDPEATYESASVHDFLGRESEAIPLYRLALSQGLSGERLPQAVIQLASSLRNVDEAEEAITLLENFEPHVLTGHADRAFLALALHDAGRPTQALRIALAALADFLPMYGRSVRRYADELTR